MKKLGSRKSCTGISVIQTRIDGARIWSWAPRQNYEISPYTESLIPSAIFRCPGSPLSLGILTSWNLNN